MSPICTRCILVERYIAPQEYNTRLTKTISLKFSQQESVRDTSKAFDKSMETTATVSLLSRLFLQSSVSLNEEVSQLKFGLYAEMKSDKIS